MLWLDFAAIWLFLPPAHLCLFSFMFRSKNRAGSWLNFPGTEWKFPAFFLQLQLTDYRKIPLGVRAPRGSNMRWSAVERRISRNCKFSLNPTLNLNMQVTFGGEGGLISNCKHILQSGRWVGLFLYLPFKWTTALISHLGPGKNNKTENWHTDNSLIQYVSWTWSPLASSQDTVWPWEMCIFPSAFSSLNQKELWEVTDLRDGTENISHLC